MLKSIALLWYYGVGFTSGVNMKNEVEALVTETGLVVLTSVNGVIVTRRLTWDEIVRCTKQLARVKKAHQKEEVRH